MLVLTRRPGQSILVGDGVELVVVRIEGDRVVLGIDAPREVRVVRTELLKDLTEEVQSAVAARARIRELLAILEPWAAAVVAAGGYPAPASNLPVRA